MDDKKLGRNKICMQLAKYGEDVMRRIQKFMSF